MSHKAIPDPGDGYCGTSYAAKLLNLSVGTVQTLVEKNELQAWKTQGGHRRISLPSVEDYQRRHHIQPHSILNGNERLRVLVVEDDENLLRTLQAHFDKWELAIDATCMTSAMTRNQVISFILSVVICLFLILAGYTPVTDLLSRWANPSFVETVAAFSVMTHYESFQRGVLDSRDFIFFFSVIGFALFTTGVIIRNHRAG